MEHSLLQRTAVLVDHLGSSSFGSEVFVKSCKMGSRLRGVYPCNTYHAYILRACTQHTWSLWWRSASRAQSHATQTRFISNIMTKCVLVYLVRVLQLVDAGTKHVKPPSSFVECEYTHHTWTVPGLGQLERTVGNGASVLLAPNSVLIFCGNQRPYQTQLPGPCLKMCMLQPNLLTHYSISNSPAYPIQLPYYQGWWIDILVFQTNTISRLFSNRRRVESLPIL